MTTPERKRIYAQYEKQLTPFSTSLVAEFRRSAEAISDIVSDDELRQWAEEGMDLARQSWRSWEAAGEFYRVTPRSPAIGSRLHTLAKHGRGSRSPRSPRR